MVTNELTVYQRIPDPLSWVRETGEIIAKSRMFGCENVEQGQALSLIAMTEGLPMLELRRRYHVVGGELTMRADFMRKELRRLGGDYDWVKDGEDGIEARMWIEFRGRKREVAYTMENARKEGLVKKGSRWEKSPGDMLRARCSTKAIRMVASEVIAGFATDEELGGEPEGDGESNHETNGKAKSSASVVESAAIVDAAATPAPAAEPAPATPSPCTPIQRAQIVKLFVALGITPEQQDAIVRKRGVGAIIAMSSVQADELLLNLETRAAAVAATAEAEADDMGGESQADATAHVVTPASPCTPAQIDRAKQLLIENAQANPDFNGKLKAKLVASGKQKLADLSEGDLNRLVEFLELKAAEKFFAMSLEVVGAVKDDDRAASEGEPKN